MSGAFCECCVSLLFLSLFMRAVLCARGQTGAIFQLTASLCKYGGHASISVQQTRASQSTAKQPQYPFPCATLPPTVSITPHHIDPTEKRPRVASITPKQTPPLLVRPIPLAARPISLPRSLAALDERDATHHRVIEDGHEHQGDVQPGRRHAHRVHRRVRRIPVASHRNQIQRRHR